MSIAKSNFFSDRHKIPAEGNHHGMEYPEVRIEANFSSETNVATRTVNAGERAPKAARTALADPLVLAARAFEHDGVIVLAVLTEPLFLSSDRKKLAVLLKHECEEAAGAPILITFDMEIYRKISRDMSEGLKTELFEKAAKQTN